MDKHEFPTLPNILSKVDPDNRAGTETALRDELTNDELALRLGRAFLKGRLEGFLRQTHDDWPFPSADECNLYAGGYQYDMHDDDPAVSVLNEMHEHGQGLPSLDELGASLHKQAAQVEEVREIVNRMKELDGQPLTLESLNEKLDLRCRVINITVGNLIERLPGMVGLQDILPERRPMATGKPDAE